VNIATTVNTKTVIKLKVGGTLIHQSEELVEVKLSEPPDGLVIREPSLILKALHLTEMSTGRVGDCQLMNLVGTWEML
jgi:hypothetical protein